MGKVTSIRLPGDQRYWLRREAKRLGISVGAVIRKAIDEQRKRQEELEWLDRVIADG
jgi:LDH2 family malate/lactate/ureidoglycolate dehydrogenase